MAFDPNNYRPEIGGWSCDILPKYQEWAAGLPDGAKCVEVGVYHGRSLLFLAETLYDLGKFHARITGVDAWCYGPQDSATFKEHRVKTGPAGALVDILEISSQEAAPRFDDGSLDLVFIDADHFYLSVKADINAWWPKVKPGGIFSGHDYSDATGVKQAVDEFERDSGQKIQHSHSVWWVVKP